jgi:hypothetical protein
MEPQFLTMRFFFMKELNENAGILKYRQFLTNQTK